MRALVIGKGNLGLDLLNVCEDSGVECQIVSRSTGFHFPSNAVLPSESYDWIFCCVGHGSVPQAEQDFLGASLAHAALPLWLLNHCRRHGSRLVLFSTDYCADELHPSDPWKSVHKPKSLYAETKLAMESHFDRMRVPGSLMVRVGSLYGDHFPEKQLAHRIRGNKDMVFVQNLVAPTPTLWIAQNVVAYLKSTSQWHEAMRSHCGPSDNVSVKQFARLVLGHEVNLESQPVWDSSRPCVSRLDNSIGPSQRWQDLWAFYSRVPLA